MKKLKNIIAASLAFFAFGSIVSAADEWSFTKTNLTGIDKSGDNSDTYKFETIKGQKRGNTPLDKYFGNYYEGYGFIVSGPEFTCTKFFNADGTEDSANKKSKVYSISTSGEVSKICDLSKLSKESNKTSYFLKTDPINGKNVIKKCEQSVDGKESCSAILTSDNNVKYTLGSPIEANSDYILYTGEYTSLYLITKEDLTGTETTKYAVYDEKGNKKLDFDDDVECGTNYCSKVENNLDGKKYTYVSFNGAVDTSMSEDAIKKATKNTSEDKSVSSINIYAISKTENYYVAKIDESFYILKANAELVSNKKWNFSSVKLVRNNTSVVVEATNDDGTKKYDFSQKAIASENSWTTSNGNLAIADNGIDLVVKYKSNDVLKVTRKSLIKDSFKGQFIGEKDNVYYFLSVYNDAVASATDDSKNSNLLVLKGKFDASEVYTCKTIDGKYYDKNGDEVSKEIYAKSCETEINRACTFNDGSYFDKDGVSVSKEAYLSSCTSLKLDKTSASIKIGETVTFKATVSGVTGTVTWTSSNPSVAKVDANGVVTGVLDGEVTITASVGDLKTVANVAVTKDAEPQPIEPSKDPEKDPEKDPSKDPKKDKEKEEKKYSCQKVNKKYYDAKGNVVDKDTYKKQCEEVDNPHTGFAISSICIIALAGIGAVIYKVKGKDAFRKI